jgi:2-succinyl-6-hydroxy-2,4-cyclohexadiene-1-carboxylate synthase
VPENLVLLHGFSGTHHAWDGVIAELDPQRYRPLAIDLPGHGEAAAPDGPIAFDSCVAAVLEQSPERFVLCGYSMGGRIALHVALAAPERVTRIVLVSSSPGIEDAVERARRRDADGRLADQLEQIPFEDFIERWRTQPLFSDEPAEVGALARQDQRRNDPLALAAAMRGIGTGEMEPLWDRLAGLTMSVTVIAGRRDTKFRALAKRMADVLPRCEVITLPGGHVLPLECPAELAGVLTVKER